MWLARRLNDPISAASAVPVYASVPGPPLRASASDSASTSWGGVSGVSLNSTPSPRRASFTALKMAAGGGMAPPSPTPLMP